MDRSDEKVKDIVDVRNARNLKDFTSDPGETLAAYLFTDITADLMSKWLERIANVSRFGSAFAALAGYRGVGKSHFLGTIGALAAHPELRARISEPHVASTAEKLLRRRYPIVNVLRGTGTTLLDEFRSAAANTFQAEEEKLGETLQSIFEFLNAAASEVPLIILVDTSMDRQNRVMRDDGSQLAEMAELAAGANIFIGVALDDDISGADGSNAAISARFGIDFLEQEHLYRIVDKHVFPKRNQKQPVLTDIHRYFREAIPDFKWSVQKFTSLYPLHPVILEIAPFVRLFVQDFALLSFASDAGRKILARPANSLIVLDEVFDKTEEDLRKSAALKDVFAAYDELNAKAVSKIPVMQRLQAKLVLKALLLQSLKGHGSTASEVAASMLIFDESDPGAACKAVEDMLRLFAAERPNDVIIDEIEGAAARFAFNIAGNEGLSNALAAAIAEIPESMLIRTMKRFFSERFSDCSAARDTNETSHSPMDCSIEWRGGWRRGYLHWGLDGKETAGQHSDWEVIIDPFGEINDFSNSADEIAPVIWKPDILKREEVETLLRFHVLTTRTDFGFEYGDQVRAAIHSHALSAERILTRSFLEDAKLVIEGFDYNLTEEARAVHSVSELLAIMLSPMFETRFPNHPKFERPIGIGDVTAIATQFYNPAAQKSADIQELVRVFAVPLGLAEWSTEGYVPVGSEKLAEVPSAMEVLRLLDSDGGEIVPLNVIYSELAKPPVGLTREAQQLVLSALVADRKIEFVTGKGDRINRRSLDLTIIWDDIAGIARPRESAYSSKRLVRWASIITRDKTFEATGAIDNQERLRAAFEDWIAEWKADNILVRFDAVAEDLVISDISRLASRCSRTFGMLANVIEAAVNGSIPFEECINRIADSFLDSESEIEGRRGELAKIKDFVTGVELSDKIDSYLAQCEITSDENIEALRERLWHFAEQNRVDPSGRRNTDAEQQFANFRSEYTEYYRERHDRVMRSPELRERCVAVLQSELLWEFNNFSKLPGFDGACAEKAEKLRRMAAGLECREDPRNLPENTPYCGCGFVLAKSAALEELPEMIGKTASSGLERFRNTLVENRDVISEILRSYSKAARDGDSAAAALEIAEMLPANGIPARLNDLQIKVLAEASNQAFAEMARA